MSEHLYGSPLAETDYEKLAESGISRAIADAAVTNLSQRGENVPVYAFEKLGVGPIREGHTQCKRLALTRLYSSMAAQTSSFGAMK